MHGRRREDARVLLVGLGGLGCPAALALVRAGVRRLGLCDDDDVEVTNLHRQVLFGERDVGTSKVDAAARVLCELAPGLDIRRHTTRLLPHDAMGRIHDYDVVVEGSDNFATKFLVADACALAQVPVVHGAAVRWVGTALAVGPHGRPCYRCLFEDVLTGTAAPNCADAGVMGPVVGVIAAAQVELALGLLGGKAVAGQLVTFDGRTEVLRRRAIVPQAQCPLCGEVPRIRDITAERYVGPSCVS